MASAGYRAGRAGNTISRGQRRSSASGRPGLPCCYRDTALGVAASPHGGADGRPAQSSDAEGSRRGGEAARARALTEPGAIWREQRAPTSMPHGNPGFSTREDSAQRRHGCLQARGGRPFDDVVGYDAPPPLLSDDAGTRRSVTNRERRPARRAAFNALGGAGGAGGRTSRTLADAMHASGGD
ncbi:unnamed protein product, partial [Ixodes hexagonus]